MLWHQRSPSAIFPTLYEVVILLTLYEQPTTKVDATQNCEETIQTRSSPSANTQASILFIEFIQWTQLKCHHKLCRQHQCDIPPFHIIRQLCIINYYSYRGAQSHALKRGPSWMQQLDRMYTQYSPQNPQSYKILQLETRVLSKTVFRTGMGSNYRVDVSKSQALWNCGIWRHHQRTGCYVGVCSYKTASSFGA